MIVASGCAINRANGGAEPGANLTAIKTVHVVHAKEDGRDINELIAQQLTQGDSSRRRAPTSARTSTPT